MTPWGRAITALQLLRIDPSGLGGLVLTARSGSVRDTFMDHLTDDTIRLHPAMVQDTLTGGIDVSASLAEGALIQQRGLLDRDNASYLLTMAERAPPLMATQLAALLDRGRGNTLIALDEHAEDEDAAPVTLTDRLAFHINLEGLSLRDIEKGPDPDLARGTATQVTYATATLETLVTLAVSLGITSLRAPMFALRAAMAHAALNRRTDVVEEDVIAAAELVLAPRATQFPQEHQPPQEAAPEEQPQQARTPSETTHLPDDILLAAIETALPPDLLGKSEPNSTKGGAGSGAGQRRIGNRRGRPLPARNTNANANAARIDLIATLRAAIPWQKLRKAAQPGRTGPVIHPTDLRYRRYEDLSDRLLIFAVDASGSAALARLGEAKGAVELLLTEAYARRDHVSLISFRGETSETLLPPTRSLVQTKRRLAELPGGGGTPLASGLNAALETALVAQRKGVSPVIILLTDGRSNIALDGTADRSQAAKDATDAARHIAQARIDSITIDTGRRPERALRDLSLSLRGRYVSLPRADAKALSQTVTASLHC